MKVMLWNTTKVKECRSWNTYLLHVRELIQAFGTPCEIEGMKYTDEQARARRGQR